MLGSGIAVCLGLVVVFFKCKWKTRMLLLSHPIALDIIVFVVLTAVHWGTFSGVMAATIGALLVSVLSAAGRKVWGYIEHKKYYPGLIDVHARLVAEKGK